MKFVYHIRQSPCNWKTTMHPKAVLPIFHTQNRYVTEIVRTTLHCSIVVLQSRQEVLKSRKNMGKIWPLVFLASRPTPCHWRTIIHSNVVLAIFNTLLHG